MLNKKGQRITLEDPVTATVIAGGAFYMSYSEGKKASAAAERQAQAQQSAERAKGRIAEVEAQRARMTQVREARLRRAQILASTGEMGMGTSGISGATSSVGTQMGSNIGTINQTQTFAKEASVANQQAAQEASNIFMHQQKAQTWQTIFSMTAPTKADFKQWMK